MLNVKSCVQSVLHLQPRTHGTSTAVRKNGIEQNCEDRFWWHFAKISKRL